jgi:cobalt-zinc-cadmium efflux system membrane fusion protein
MRSEIGIVAPISGYIHHINITMGKYTDANAVLFDMVDNRYLHLDLTIFEKDIHKVALGQKVLFTDANDPLHDHPAAIYGLDKAFQDNQQAIVAHARIGERTETLLPGMYVEARIQIDRYLAAALPDAAVVSSGDDHFIYLMIGARRYRQIAVKTGAQDQGYTEIIPLVDLPKDARIVTKGAYYLLSEVTKGSGEE